MICIIGITGGIGAGKSVVSRICRIKGFPVYDCDSEAKRIMDSSETLKTQLISRCGNGIVDTEGNICRKKLAENIFSDDDLRQWINSTVHSMVREDFRLWSGKMQKEGAKICFVESAILSTSELDRMCRRIWLVECDDRLRVDRVTARGGISHDNIILRMEAQRLEFDRLPARLTDRIANDGSSSLLLRIDELVNSLKKDYKIFIIN